MSAGNSLSEPQLNSYIVYKSFSYILFCCITEINYWNKLMIMWTLPHHLNCICALPEWWQCTKYKHFSCVSTVKYRLFLQVNQKEQAIIKIIIKITTTTTTTILIVLSSWPRSLREFTRFIWWIDSANRPPTLRPSHLTWALSPLVSGSYRLPPSSPFIIPRP